MATTDTQNENSNRKSNHTTPKRILWFVGLWCLGVLAIGTISYVLRLIIQTAFPN